MRTANPALNAKTFTNLRITADSAVMTIQGTVNKTLSLLLLTVIAASYVWGKAVSWDPSAAMPWMAVGAIGGLIVALITTFNKTAGRITAPLYAILEGLFLGGISAIFEKIYPGIVFQAVALTFGTLFCLLIAYKSRLIKPTENFKLGIAAATGGIAVFYLVTMLLSLFHVNIGFMYASSPLGIGISLFVVVIAALNLVLDFDFIESGAAQGAPKYMEWYGAFGLLVTLVWLYLEILRLLAKLADRR
jgi:uncharacterized YccA/Bax inhibitor family protein